MKIEDIEVGKWYYWKFAYETRVGRVLGTGLDAVVISLETEPYTTIPQRVIAEAEEPKPITAKSIWERIRGFFSC